MRLTFSVRTFFQVNHELLVPLVHEATRNARGTVAMILLRRGFIHGADRALL